MFEILLSYLACSCQIWLNLHMDDCHFGHITKSTPKKKKKTKQTLVPASFFLLAIFSQKAKLKTKKALKSMLF
jgi:hypothetical protein